jgi:hypothetical protein
MRKPATATPPYEAKMKNIFKKQEVTIISRASSQSRPTSSRAALLCRLAVGSLMLASAQFALSQPAVTPAPDSPTTQEHRHHHHRLHIMQASQCALSSMVRCMLLVMLSP